MSKTQITTQPNVLTQLDSFITRIGKETYKNFEKGGEAKLPEVKPNDTFAWRWSYRDSAEVTSYPFPEQVNSFYPGKIILADDKFHSHSPTMVNFKSVERAPISIVTSLQGLSSKKVQNITEINAGEMLDGIRENFVIPKYKESDSFLAEDLEMDVQYFEEASGFEIGGGITLKDVGLNVDFSNKKNSQVLLITLRQIMYQVSLNDIYTKSSDFFTDKLDLAELQKACLKNGRYYPLAIVDNVSYGRKVYIAISSSDYSSGLNGKISKDKFDLKGGFDKSFKDASFSVKIVGGKSSEFKGLSGKLSFDSVNELLKALVKPLTAKDVLYAAPIEFSASFLYNFKTPERLMTKIHNKYAERVDQIRLKFVRETYGTLVNLKLRYLHPYHDRNGILRWKMDFIDKKNINDCNLGLISPLSCVFEFKIDKHGDRNDSYDYNVYVPEIPLDKLKREKDGVFAFTFYVRGALGNKQHYVFPHITTVKNLKNSPMIYGSGIKTIFSSESQFYFASRSNLLKEFYAWVERLKEKVGWSNVHVG